ncbi:MAG: phosphoribosylformylglycinamidine synthase II, partial [Candidatus Dadabacteria bacterium]
MKERWNKEVSQAEAKAFGLKEEEYKRIKKHFPSLTFLELGILAALFSEHCSYKSTLPYLKKLFKESPLVVSSEGENAGAVKLNEKLAAVFKIESHNHPSYIEPFQGAATGVGGILRDIFTMGARPIALLNSLHFGELSHKKTNHLLNNVVSGIGFYGNCMGIPTIGGETKFHFSYNGNCLVNAYALGVLDVNKICPSSTKESGDLLCYAGSKTGRDGIHGAVMASDTFSKDDTQEKRSAVQIGDPFQQKKLMEACLEAVAKGLLTAMQDMGAAGLTSSTFEMAKKGKSGLLINLNKVPLREKNMDPFEIMLSESQERMVLLVPAKNLAAVKEIFKRWEVDLEVIGESIQEKVI